jgi:AraC-like DNA-binding protein
MTDGLRSKMTTSSAMMTGAATTAGAPSGDGATFRVAGPLLERARDDEGELGFVYEKRGSGARGEATFADAALIFARGATVLEVRGVDGTTRLDTWSYLVLPAGEALEWRALTAVCDFVVLRPRPQLIARTARDYGLVHADVARHLARRAAYARTNWINELMHRYVFERVVAKASDNPATSFLAAELVKEAHYRAEEAGRARRQGIDLDPRAGGALSPPVRKALAFIEANLFATVTSAQVAKHAGASESTLLRAFQEELAATPIAYLSSRRLDEAMSLLKSRRYSVTEVADLVGYESLSAFSAAFRKRFGHRPSELA